MKSLVNYSPLKMNSFLEDFFNRDITSFFGNDASISQPSVNVVETENDFRIDLAVPGLDKEDFNLEVDRNRLTISAEKEHREEVNEDQFMRREFNYTSFTRSFQLPETVNAEAIAANYKNGVLSVTLPKLEEMKGEPVKKIEIK